MHLVLSAKCILKIKLKDFSSSFPFFIFYVSIHLSNELYWLNIDCPQKKITFFWLLCGLSEIRAKTLVIYLDLLWNSEFWFWLYLCKMNFYLLQCCLAHSVDGDLAKSKPKEFRWNSDSIITWILLFYEMVLDVQNEWPLSRAVALIVTHTDQNGFL